MTESSAPGVVAPGAPGASGWSTDGGVVAATDDGNDGAGPLGSPARANGLPADAETGPLPEMTHASADYR